MFHASKRFFAFSIFFSGLVSGSRGGPFSGAALKVDISTILKVSEDSAFEDARPLCIEWSTCEVSAIPCNFLVRMGPRMIKAWLLLGST